MANNILTAEIKVIAPGAAEAFSKVSKEVKKTEATLQQVGTTSVSTGKTITVLSDNVKKTGEAATKSTGGLKSLVGGLNLTGIAGIAALGALAALGKEVFNLITGANKLASAATMLAEAQQKAAASTKEEVVQLSLLYGVARNTANSYGERQAAIEKMNKLYPDLLNNINLENIGTLKVAASIGLVIQNLVKKAQLQQLVTQIAELSNEAEKLSSYKLFGPLSKERENAIQGINKRVKELTQSAIELQSAALGTSFKSIGAIAGTGGEAPEKEIKVPKIKIQKVDKLSWTDLIDWEDKPEFPKEKIYEDVSDAGERAAAIFKDAFENRLTTEEPIDFGLITKSLEKTFSFKGFDGLSQMQFEAAQTAETIANTLTPSLEAMIQAIGRGENAFQAFGEGVKAILVQVISKLVSTLILAAALSAFGVGGSVFANFTKLLGFRAKGGPVSAGGSYIVGEEGPELFTPNTGGNIVPNNRLGRGIGASGGMMVQVSGEFVQRGQDLVAAITLANQSRNRLQ